MDKSAIEIAKALARPWLMSQSAANPSANANSLLAGNLQGIFPNLNQIRRKVYG